MCKIYNFVMKIKVKSFYFFYREKTRDMMVKMHRKKEEFFFAKV